MGWIDFVILILLGVNIWTGYHGGTVRAVISVVGMIAGIEFASRNFQRFAKELAPMVHSLAAANAIWFILQVFIVLLAFNFIGHALQHEVGQMLHHDHGEADKKKQKTGRKDAPVEEAAHGGTNAHHAQHALHEQHTHPLQHEHHQIHIPHGQTGHFEQQHHVEHAPHAETHGHHQAPMHQAPMHQAPMHHDAHAHHEAQANRVSGVHRKENSSRAKALDHEVVSSQTEGAWTKVSATDGVIGGLLGLVRGIVLGCVFIMATAAFFPGADTLPDAFLPRYLTGTTAVLANLTSRSVHKKIILGLDAAEPNEANPESQPDPNAPGNPDAPAAQGPDAPAGSQNSPNP